MSDSTDATGGVDMSEEALRAIETWREHADVPLQARIDLLALVAEVAVDSIAGWIAHGLGHEVEPYPVDHRVDGPWPGAGPRRNARMLAKSKPDRGLAFGALWRQRFNGTYFVDWKRTGTGDMVSRMLRARLPVRWIASPDAPAVDLVEMPEPPR